MLTRRYVTLLLVFSLASILVVSAEIDTNGEFKLTVLHTNDMHSRVEETNRVTGVCKPPEPCYGGFARLAHKVKELKSSIKNTLFLNAGDTYQGTPMYTLFKWHILVPLMNMLGIDVMSLGNHEFDDGISGLTPFLQQIRVPVVACNIDTSNEPSMVNRTALKPWHMLKIENVKIAIIGYLTPATKIISSPGKLIILDEVESLRKCAKEAKIGGANLVFALGHSGFYKDLEIAERVPEIDLVVGGHSHTFLYSGTPPDDIDKPLDTYPVMVVQVSGKKVPVVQAFQHTKYLGKLDIIWNSEFQLMSVKGNPILLDSSVAKDKRVEDEVKIWTSKLNGTLKEKRGVSRVFLDGQCRMKECNLGNLITDSFIHEAVLKSGANNTEWTEAPIAVCSGGGIRIAIERGDITYGDLLTVLPFGMKLIRLRMKGSVLMKALQRSIERYNGLTGRGEFLQFSGLKVEYEQNDDEKFTVKRVITRCGKCSVPKYEELDINKDYSVLTNTFIANGGDGYTMFLKEATREHIYDKLDVNIVGDYIKKMSPVYIGEEDRIIFKKNYKI